MGYMPPKPPMKNEGWITGVGSVCVVKSYSINGTDLPIANQNLSYHRFPTCAVCNRFVEKFEQVERFDMLALVFRADCHGRVEGEIITREQLRADPDCVQKLVSRPWFIADYEKLKAAQPKPKAEPPKVPSLLDKPTRQIDLE